MSDAIKKLIYCYRSAQVFPLDAYDKPLECNGIGWFQTRPLTDSTTAANVQSLTRNLASICARIGENTVQEAYGKWQQAWNGGKSTVWLRA